MLSIILRDPTSGVLWWDVTAQTRGVKFSTNEHGYAALHASLALPLADAFRLYERPGAMRVSVFDQAVASVWDGRLEDVAITNAGASITALGYWRALSDIPYTALWAWTAVDGQLGSDAWREVSKIDLSAYQNSKYKQWKHPDPGVGGLLIAPRKNETFDVTAGDIGAYTWETPKESSATITTVAFNYTLVAPNTWRMVLYSYDRDWTNAHLEWSLDGNGGTQTGTVTQNLATPRNRIVFGIRYLNASSQFTGETGDIWCRAGQISVTSTSAAVTSDVIVSGLITAVATANSYQLVNNAMLVQAPGVTLTDELYQDETPAAVLTKLAGLGDNQTPPRQWEVGVWDFRMLHFRPRGDAGRAWYVDVTGLQLERSLEGMYNSAYATYRDPGGGNARTATVNDTYSQVRWGITRRAAVSTQTTSATQAAVQRDAYLEDHRRPPGRAAIAFDAVYDATGGRWPLYSVRSGDTITIRNLSPALSTDVDRVRTFRVLGTEYDCDADVLTVEPETPLPRLDLLVARLGEGV